MPNHAGPIFYRALLVLLGLAAALYAFRLAATEIFETRQPQLGLLLGGSSATLWGTLAGQELAAGKGLKPLDPQTRASLLRAIQTEPLSRRALRTLAIDAQLRDQPREAAAIMALAHRVSRRDLATQYWLLTEAARRNQWPRAFRHMDAAMSTRPQAWDMLFPAVSNGLANADLRAALARAITAGRPWGPPFVDHAIANAPNSDDVAALLAAIRFPADNPQYRTLQAKLIPRFAAEGKLATARAFAIARLDAKPAELDNFAMSAATTQTLTAPLSWQIVAQPHAQLAWEGDGVAIDIAAGPKAVVLTRSLPMAPGSYRLRFTAQVPEGAAPASGEWVLSCVTGNRLDPLTTIPLLPATGGKQTTFQLPPGCAGARFDLVLNGDVEGDSVELLVSSLALMRA